MTKLAPEWVRTSDPVIRSPARYRWTTAPAWVDEDDWWGWSWHMKVSQKTIDTCSSKILHQNETQSTGSVGKGFDSQLSHYQELQTLEWAWSSLPGGSWEEVKSWSRGTTYHRTVGCIEIPSSRTLLPFMPGTHRIIYNWPPSRPHLVAFYDIWGEGCLLLPRSSMGTLLLDLCPEAEHIFSPFRGRMSAHISCILTHHATPNKQPFLLICPKKWI